MTQVTLQDGILSGTTAQILLRTLVDNGVRDVFALPGIQNSDLFDALYDAKGLRTISDQ
ncbi:thiamine pyrophosphate-binding protein [Candidimonas nitroreducens]|uniref:Thiamine pyrophosphate enzyme N-terminal TPP-binding domain-containing protein n=1 Tax=Candidimonas nitroreducens TaxID=683354 RepID=A0A225M6E7_9BURK|nr:thiamine pyrophosphate-binding protein [Candidimonas nitroreducens]OWT56848.1 hypothetical protein CEY11_18390 [Candidimonas nitroreducens]